MVITVSLCWLGNELGPEVDLHVFNLPKRYESITVKKKEGKFF